MLLAVLFLPVMSDAAEMPSFHDGADIVKGEAAAEVKNALETVEKKHNVRIAVVTQPSVEGMKIGDYADKLLGTVIKGGEKGNMVLVLDMQERDCYIATDPKMKAMITNDIGIKLMKDAFVSKLSAGNYAEAFKAYAEKADFLISYYEKEGKAYDPDDQFSFLGLGIAAVLSLLGAFGVRNYLIGTMSNVAPGVNASHYLDKDSFAVTGENDYYLYTNRIVTPLPERKMTVSSEQAAPWAAETEATAEEAESSDNA